MEYVNPIGKTGGATYVDGNPEADIEGDAVSAKAWEYPMREILNVIIGAGLVPNGENLAQMFAAIQTMIAAAISGLPPADTLPVGSILPCPSTTPWPGFYLADGSILTREDDAALWAYAEGSFNIVDEVDWTLATSGSFSRGDGSTTFRIPDYRGVGLRGFDGGRGLDPARVFGTYQADQMQRITGSGASSRSSSSPSGAIYLIQQEFLIAGGGDSISGLGFDSALSPGARTGDETRMMNTAVNFCIKY